MATRGHRFFAAVWDRQSRGESKKVKQLRQRVVGGARGAVLEIGVGVGSNWEYLPEGIDYTGIEPDEFMLRRARGHAASAGRELALEPYDVQSLPFEDGRFDTVITTLTFCSVADPARGLREVHRVLKPGGQFRFGEHVRSENRAYALVQRTISPLMRRVAGGCEHDRDTIAAVRAAGFTVADLQSERVAGIPMVTGVATR